MGKQPQIQQILLTCIRNTNLFSLSYTLINIFPALWLDDQARLDSTKIVERKIPKKTHTNRETTKQAASFGRLFGLGR